MWGEFLLIIFFFFIIYKISSIFNKNQGETYLQNNQENKSKIIEFIGNNVVFSESKSIGYHPINQYSITLTKIDKNNAKVLAPQYLKMANDSARIINSTKNPDVFFSRYELLLNKVHGLIQIQKYVKFSGESPTQMLKQIENKYNQSVSDFIERFYKDTLEKIKSLKSENAKNKNIQKFYDTLRPYFIYMDDSIVYKIDEHFKYLRNGFRSSNYSVTTSSKGTFKSYWDSLSKDELNCFFEYYPKYVGIKFEISLIFNDDDICSFTDCIMVYHAMKKDDYAVRLIRYVEDFKLSSTNPVMLHFFYIYVVRVLYQPTKLEINDTEKSKTYCYKDIDLILNNLADIRAISSDNKLPFIPSIKTLAIILEKEKKYDEAIRICDIAIELELDDKTKAGYIGRKQRLLKKKLI